MMKFEGLVVVTIISVADIGNSSISVSVGVHDGCVWDVSVGAMKMLLVLGLVVMVEVLVWIKVVAVVVLGMGEEGSVGDDGDIVGVGNAGASAGACDNGGSADDDSGSHLVNDHEGCVVGEAISVADVGVGNDKSWCWCG